MTKEELNKLQRYMGKRPQGQTDEQVIARIEKIDRKTPLTQEEWSSLLFPVCANGETEMARFLLGRIQTLSNGGELMSHTLRFRKRDPAGEGRQVELLRLLLGRIGQEERESALNQALVNAAWYGEFAAVKFLVEAGADIRCTAADGRSILELSRNAVEKFRDARVYNYLSARLGIA